MKKLLFGLLLSCSGSLTAGIKEVVASIHEAFEALSEKDRANGMNKRESSKLIVPLLVSIADYDSCGNLSFCESITNVEQENIASFVTAFVEKISAVHEQGIAIHSQFVHYLVQTLKNLPTLSPAECLNYDVYKGYSKLPDDMQLAHNNALLKAFCFSLRIMINFFDKIVSYPSKKKAIEGVQETTTFINEQYEKINDLFIKKQYETLTELCFKTVWKKVLGINVEKVVKNEDEKDQKIVETSIFIEFFKKWQKYCEGNGSYLSQTDITLEAPFKSGYESSVSISYTKIGKASLKGVIVGGGLYYVATHPKTKKTVNRAYTFAGDHPILTAALVTAISGTVAGVASVINQIQ